MEYTKLLEALKAEAESFSNIHRAIGYFEEMQKTYREYVANSKKNIRRAVREEQYWLLKADVEALERRQDYLDAYTEVLTELYPLGSAELDREEAERVGA